MRLGSALRRGTYLAPVAAADGLSADAEATASEIVGAIHALLDGLGSWVQDDAAVLALGMPAVTSRERP